MPASKKKKARPTAQAGGGGGADVGAAASGDEPTAKPSPPVLSPKAMYPKHCSVVTQEAGHQLLLAKGAFTPAECAGWIAFCEGLGLVSTRPRGGRPVPGNAYRDNYRVQLTDLGIAEALWSSGLGAVIAASLSLSLSLSRSLWGQSACAFLATNVTETNENA